MPKATPRLEAVKGKGKAHSKSTFIPDATPLAGPSQLKSQGKGSAKSKVSAAAAAVAPKLYSNFLPIPLLLPSPQSTSKTSTKATATHYIYVRAHAPKPSTVFTTEEGGEEQGARTAFVVNLPVDCTERDLRALFGRWGVVEGVTMKGREGGGDVLENEVRGLEPAQSDDEDEDEDDDSDAEQAEQEDDDEDAGAARAEATFQGDLLEPLTKTARRKAKKAAKTVPSIPSVVALPPLDPRSTPLGVSGLSSAHVTFVDSLSLSRLLASSPAPIPFNPNRSKSDDPTGLQYYAALHRALRPSLDQVKEHADTSMAKYDHLHSLLLSSRAKARGAGALVDEDGFTVVVRSGRYGRAGARGDGLGNKGVGIASAAAIKKGMGKKKGAGAQALEGFYKFQKLDQRRRELADLRTKFEHDKAKVDELKKSRRFKPY